MRNSNVPVLSSTDRAGVRLMAFPAGLFARKAVVDAAGRRINVIGNRDTFQRAEFVQRECFDLFFHLDFLSPLRPPPNKAETMPDQTGSKPLVLNHRRGNVTQRYNERTQRIFKKLSRNESYEEKKTKNLSLPIGERK